MTALAIKFNNCATNDPCAICGAKTGPSIGYELFLADSYDLVCYECGRKHAPVLVAMLEASGFIQVTDKNSGQLIAHNSPLSVDITWRNSER